jgi:hypothetical protein
VKKDKLVRVGENRVREKRETFQAFDKKAGKQKGK